MPTYKAMCSKCLHVMDYTTPAMKFNEGPPSCTICKGTMMHVYMQNEVGFIISDKTLKLPAPNLKKPNKKEKK